MTLNSLMDKNCWMQQIVRQPMLSRSFTIEKLTLNHAKCYGNSFKYRHVSCVGVEDTGSCRNVSYCVLSRTYIHTHVHHEHKHCANIHTIISFSLFLHGHDSPASVWAQARLSCRTFHPCACIPAPSWIPWTFLEILCQNSPSHLQVFVFKIKIWCLYTLTIL